MCMGKCKISAQGGFSMLELLVVVGVMFVLACVFLPALSIAKQTSRSERCLNNLHQLTSAWLMYASANSDACCNNYGVSQTDASHDTWCTDVMDWTANSQNTNVSLLRLGQLTPYLGSDMTRFKCPADIYISAAQVKAGFKYRVRSYSMSAYFGHFSNGKTGSDPTYQGKNYFDTSHRQFVKVTDVPEPAAFFVFLEEHPDSINDGFYAVGDIGSAAVFGDVPASYHSGSCGFSFSDGHVETHLWQDPRHAGRPGSGIAGLPVSYTSQGDVTDTPPFNDIHWTWQHSSVLFKP